MEVYQRVWLNLDADILFFTSDTLLIPTIRMRRLELNDGHDQKDENRKGKEYGREKPPQEIGDDTDEQNALDRIIRVALSFNALCLDTSYFRCGTGAQHALDKHHDHVQKAKAVLQTLPSLQNMYIVVSERLEQERNEMNKKRAEQGFDPWSSPRPLGSPKPLGEAQEKKLKLHERILKPGTWLRSREKKCETETESSAAADMIKEQEFVEFAGFEESEELVEFEVSARFTKKRYEEIRDVVYNYLGPDTLGPITMGGP